MMGGDCERILSSITTIIGSLNDMMATVTSMMSSPITLGELKQDWSLSYGSEGGVLNFGIDVELEEQEGEAIGSLGSISDATTSLSSDASKMANLASNLYSDVSSFNNSAGSPWIEISNLNSACSNLQSFVSTNGNFVYVSQKVALMSLLNSVMTLAVDAKWAIITYHDYVQRGYDCVYNGNTPSVTTKRTINEYTTGNLKQTIANNVNIAEESIDPF